MVKSSPESYAMAHEIQFNRTEACEDRLALQTKFEDIMRQISEPDVWFLNKSYVLYKPERGINFPFHSWEFLKESLQDFYQTGQEATDFVVGLVLNDQAVWQAEKDRSDKKTYHQNCLENAAFLAGFLNYKMEFDPTKRWKRRDFSLVNKK